MNENSFDGKLQMQLSVLGLIEVSSHFSTDLPLLSHISSLK